MDFKDYVEGEMKYYEEYYAEMNIVLKEYGYDCDIMDIEYTTADWYKPIGRGDQLTRCHTK